MADDSDFWSEVEEDEIVVRGVPETAAYITQQGRIAIRQEASMYSDAEPVVVLPIEAAETLIVRLRMLIDRVREEGPKAFAR